MRLPSAVHTKVLYILERFDSLRKGTLPVDPQWLTCVDRVLENVPDSEMRDFFEQFFVQGLSCDDVQFNLFIERSTMYAWRDYFLWHIALEAAAHDLLHW